MAETRLERLERWSRNGRPGPIDDSGGILMDTTAFDRQCFDGLHYSSIEARDAAVARIATEPCDRRCALGYCRHDAARKEVKQP